MLKKITFALVTLVGIGFVARIVASRVHAEG